MSRIPKGELEREFHDIFERRYFANNGPLVQQFDREFARVHQVRFAIAVASGDIAAVLGGKILAAHGGNVWISNRIASRMTHALRWAGLSTEAKGAPVVAFALAEEETPIGVPVLRDLTSKVGGKLSDVGDVGLMDLRSFGGGCSGGVLVTQNEGLAQALRTMRNFHASETFAEVPLRMNAKMSEAQAAIALVALRNIERALL